MQDQSVSNCGQGHPCRARKDVSPTDSGNSNISQGKHVPVVFTIDRVGTALRLPILNVLLGILIHGTRLAHGRLFGVVPLACAVENNHRGGGQISSTRFLNARVVELHFIQ
jgi:hypothetical protein